MNPSTPSAIPLLGAQPAAVVERRAVAETETDGPSFRQMFDAESATAEQSGARHTGRPGAAGAGGAAHTANAAEESAGQQEAAERPLAAQPAGDIAGVGRTSLQVAEGAAEEAFADLSGLTDRSPGVIRSEGGDPRVTEASATALSAAAEAEGLTAPLLSPFPSLAGSAAIAAADESLTVTIGAGAEAAAFILPAGGGLAEASLWRHAPGSAALAASGEGGSMADPRGGMPAASTAAALGQWGAAMLNQGPGNGAPNDNDLASLGARVSTPERAATLATALESEGLDASLRLATGTDLGRQPLLSPSAQFMQQLSAARWQAGEGASELTAAVNSAAHGSQSLAAELPGAGVASAVREPDSLLNPASLLRGQPGLPQWHAAVAERVLLMASQRLSEAEIQLDPPELGQLQVRVSLQQEQASVSFVSQHAAVREALDQTAFRLREMFESEGFDLVDVDVSDQAAGGGAQDSEEPQRLAATEPDAEADDASSAAVAVSRNLVDHFV